MREEKLPFNLQIQGQMVPLGAELPPLWRFGIYAQHALQLTEVSIEALSEQWPTDLLSGDTLSASLPKVSVYLAVTAIDMRFPMKHKHALGYKLEPGHLEIRGTLLNRRPERYVTFADWLADYPDQWQLVDHTMATGSVSEA